MIALARLIALVLVCAAFSACAPTTQEHWHNEDVAILTHTLLDAHPDLFFEEPWQLFAQRMHTADDVLSRTADHSSAAGFYTLAPVIAALGDAHTGLDPYTSDYQKYRDAGGKLFPLELRFEGTRAIVTANYEAGLRVPVNAVVTSISGLPISQVVRRLETLTSGETSTIRRSDIAENLRALMWLDRLEAPFRITFYDPQMHAHAATAFGCTVTDIHLWDNSAAGIKQLSPYIFTYNDVTRVGLLTIHNFNVDDASNWHSFLDNVSDKLEKKGAKSLVIDIRQNDGGDTELSDDLLSRFARHPFRDFSEVDIKVSRVVKNALGHEQYVQIYGEDAWDATDGTVLTNNVEAKMSSPSTKRFTGKVILLIGSGTYSTAAIFASAAKTSHNAIILGQPSGGMATLYGELFSFVLPDSHINATVSTKFLVAPDGNRTLHPVEPDRFLTESPQGDHDRELADALAIAAIQ